MPDQSNPLTPHGAELVEKSAFPSEIVGQKPGQLFEAPAAPTPKARIHKGNLGELFRYHAPTNEQAQQYVKVREAAYFFAATVLDYTPSCADQQAAIRHIREAMMTANAAIALDGMC